MENNENEKRSIRVGRNTFGITLIIFGISAILQMFLKFEIFRYILMLWPAIFILLGIEIIYYNNKKDVKIKYDVAGIILLFCIVGFGSLMAFGSFAINDVLYNGDIKQAIINNSISDEFNLNLDDKVNIVNNSDKVIDLKIVEVDSVSSNIINISGNYDENKINNVVDSISNNYSVINSINVVYNDNTIIINENEYINSIDITITTNNKDNISYTGNVNLV